MAIVGIGCRPEGNGFWYKISGPMGSRFWASYFLVGTGGHQTVGDIDGIVEGEGQWRYWPAHFEVMYAGITEFDVKGGATQLESGDNGDGAALAERASFPRATMFAAAGGGDPMAATVFTSPYDPYP